MEVVVFFTNVEHCHLCVSVNVRVGKVP